MEPAIPNAFFECPETDGAGKVETGGGQDAGNQPGALAVEVTDEEVGHEAAQYPLNRQLMEPAPVPGQQGDGGGQKNKGQGGADPAEDGRVSGARLHPRPADSG